MNERWRTDPLFANFVALLDKMPSDEKDSDGRIINRGEGNHSEASGSVLERIHEHV